MTGPVLYTQHCPTCGRRLHIRVEFLGKQLRCRHCGGVFEARDPAQSAAEPDEDLLLQRAQELLGLSTQERRDLR